MSVANTILELNDSGLRLLQGGRLLLESPGIALVNEKQCLLGVEALQQSKLHPLQTHSQFWQNLDSESLGSSNPKCRHQADLVFEHLQAIKALQGDMSNLILALPAHYTKAQLSLLLGIAQHCQLAIVGLVDTAVASVANQAEAGRHCFIDFQLHQALVSHVDVGQEVSNAQIETVPGAGLLACYDAWAHLIAEQFIQQTRFNPLHSAATEQLLHNQLDDFLQRAQRDGEATLELAGHKTTLALTTLAATSKTQLEKIAAQTGHYSGHLYMTERCHSLPGVAEVFPEAIAVTSVQLANNIEHHEKTIVQKPGGLKLIGSLPARAGIAPRVESKKTATHILWNHQAFPVNTGLSIVNDASAPIVRQAQDNEGICAIAPLSGALCIKNIQADGLLINGKKASEGQTLVSGDQLKIPTLPHAFIVISVVPSDGA